MHSQPEATETSPRVSDDTAAQRQLGPPTPATLAVAFSGGGFRATLFHLGVLLTLLRNQLIGPESVVVGVSGGAILAAFWGTNPKSLTPETWPTGDNNEFDRTLRRLLKLVQCDLRNRVFRRHVASRAVIAALLIAVSCTAWPVAIGTFTFGWNPPTANLAVATAALLVLFLGRRFANLGASLGDILTDQYNRWLYDDATLESLHQSIYLTATSLTNGQLCVAGAGHIALYNLSGEWTSGNRESSTRISRLIAASSAFPPAFPPVPIDFTSPTGSTRHSMTDGGVFDNLGIWTLRNTLGGQIPPDVRTRWTLVVDAAAPLQERYNEPFHGIVRRNARASDLLMYRVGAADLSVDSYTLHCPILAQRPEDRPVNAPSGKSDKHQKRLADVRTDLNSFSDSEVFCLVSHGSASATHLLNRRFPDTAWKEVTGNEVAMLLGLSNQPDRYLSAFERDYDSRQLGGRVRRFKAAAREIAHFLFARDWVCLAWLIPMAMFLSAGWAWTESRNSLARVDVELRENSRGDLTMTVNGAPVRSTLTVDILASDDGELLRAVNVDLPTEDNAPATSSTIDKRYLHDVSYDQLLCRIKLLSRGRVIEQVERSVKVNRK